MHPLVPDFILNQSLAGECNGSFPAVGLFLDISGFSAMADALMAHGQHGAEVLAGVMRSVLDPLIDQVCAQDGFIAFSAGDALTALFPEHDPAAPAVMRALAAARAMQERMAAVPLHNTGYGQFRVSAKIGLAAGEVRWGILLQGAGLPQAVDSRAQAGGHPSPARAVYYFQGPAVEGCAEIEHFAQAGEVLVDQPVREAAGAGITTRPIDDGLLKAGGARAWRVLSYDGPWPAPVPLRLPLASPAAVEAAALFFPRSVLTQAAAGEFRQVVNMFISLPATRTETQLALFMESLFDLQDRYGGMINHIDFGDKGTNLLMFWGAPAAHENDIERALNFILDLQTITSIPISAGITYRISHAGFIGGTRHEEYTCFGRGVNLAARFMTSAPRGEIWLDEPVARRAASHFELEFVKEAPFKGFKEPQKVYVLLERKEQAEPLYQGRLVGREEQLDRLLDLIAPPLRGEPAGMIVVTGEPGIGKSRLVHTFLAGLEASSPFPLQVFLTQSDEILRQPLNPLVYWLRRYFGISEMLGEARSKRSFNRKLDELIAAVGDREPALADELDRTRSFLGALVGLHWPDSLYEQLDAAGRYANTFSALTTLLLAESRRAAVVVFVEDIHWLDADSTTFLLHLARVLQAGRSGSGSAPNAVPESAGYPLAILATSRPAADHPLLRQEFCSELVLGGITRSGLESLAGDHLGGPASRALLDMLEAHAEGNPFYAEQILRYLQDEGWLVWDGAAWAVRPGKRALPADVNVLLVARLDRLSQQVKEVVQMAAVLGREFEVTLLSYMLKGIDANVLPEVAAAEHEAIWTAISEIRYIFKHALLREAAYEMQLLQRRQDLHAHAMRAYEVLYQDRLAEVAGELAYHAEQAGLREPALRYLEMAGKAAGDSYHNAQAVDFYSRALALLPEGEINRRVHLLVEREIVYERTGNLEGRRADLAVLETLLPGLVDDALQLKTCLSLSFWHRDRGDHDRSMQRSQQALELARRLGDLPSQSRTWSSLAKSLQQQGRLEEALAHIQEGLLVVQAAQDEIEQSRVLNTLGLILIDLGRLEDARLALEESLQIARRTGKLNFQGPPANNLGLICGSQGRFTDALGYYQEALQIARKIGDLTSQALALGNLGFIEGQLGEFGKAGEYIEQQLRTLRLTGKPYYEAYAYINLSSITGALGDAENAGQMAQQGLALARQTGDRSGEAWALTYLGHSCLARGRLDEAREAYHLAAALRDMLQQPILAAEPAAGLARVALEQGDLPAARQALEGVLAHLAGGGALDGADQPLRVYLTCYLVLERAGDPRAAGLLAAGYALLMAQAERITNPETRQAFFDNITHHREILHEYNQIAR